MIQFQNQTRTFHLPALKDEVHNEWSSLSPQTGMFWNFKVVSILTPQLLSVPDPCDPLQQLGSLLMLAWL